VTGWSIWMLEYARCTAHPAGAILYGSWNQGTRYLAYSYVYLEGNGHRVLVDVGYDAESSNAALAAASNVVDWQPPETVLARVGARPEQIDTIILTHAHYDHMGGLRFFPNADIYIQRRELESSEQALERGVRFAIPLSALDPLDLERARELEAAGRLRLVEGQVHELLPGIDLHPAFDSHTDGSQFVLIRNGADRWVVTGDNMFGYDNAGEPGAPHVPIGFGSGSAWRSLEVIDEMLTLAATRDRLIVVHEPATFERFPSAGGAGGLRVAELSLADGVRSRIDDTSFPPPTHHSPRG
jgi:N-acyl homoserine lactone hydrolase